MTGNAAGGQIGADLVYHALGLMTAAARVGELAKKHKYHGHGLNGEDLLAALAVATWEIDQIRRMIGDGQCARDS